MKTNECGDALLCASQVARVLRVSHTAVRYWTISGAMAVNGRTQAGKPLYRFRDVLGFARARAVRGFQEKQLAAIVRQRETEAVAEAGAIVRDTCARA